MATPAVKSPLLNMRTNSGLEPAMSLPLELWDISSIWLMWRLARALKGVRQGDIAARRLENRLWRLVATTEGRKRSLSSVIEPVQVPGTPQISPALPAQDIDPPSISQSAAVLEMILPDNATQILEELQMPTAEAEAPQKFGAGSREYNDIFAMAAAVESQRSVPWSADCGKLAELGLDKKNSRKAREWLREVKKVESTETSSRVQNLAWRLSQLLERRDGTRQYKVFVYGTLKSGFHYNHLLQNANTQLVGASRLHRHLPLFIDFYGVPYLWARDDADFPQPVGEVYEIDKHALKVLDEIEGYPGRYDRLTVEATVVSGDRTGEEVSCFVYGLPADTQGVDLACPSLTVVANYTLEMHKERYVPRALRKKSKSAWGGYE